MYWGPPTWIFLHTLAEKIKESEFSSIKNEIIFNIILICKNLPCPDCSKHAMNFWNNTVNLNKIIVKQDLINVLFTFHNVVNNRKHLLKYRFENLNIYKQKNLLNTFNNFAKKFHTKGNMNMINESFHRQKALGQLKKWLMININKFDFN
jgi:hypothetical protein